MKFTPYISGSPDRDPRVFRALCVAHRASAFFSGEPNPAVTKRCLPTYLPLRRLKTLRELPAPTSIFLERNRSMDMMNMTNCTGWLMTTGHIVVLTLIGLGGAAAIKYLFFANRQRPDLAKS